MDKMIDALSAYFSTNGSLSDAVAFAQAVGSDAWGTISKLFHVVLG